MTIGEAAAASGLTPKMIRYYERIGLLRAPARSGGNYRTYGPAEIDLLRFVRRARGLGFPLDRVRRLLSLWRDERRTSAEVKRLALAQVAELEERIAALDAMRRSLAHLAESCAGDHRPDCPILEDLQGMT